LIQALITPKDGEVALFAPKDEKQSFQKFIESVTIADIVVIAVMTFLSLLVQLSDIFHFGEKVYGH